LYSDLAIMEAEYVITPSVFETTEIIGLLVWLFDNYAEVIE